MKNKHLLKNVTLEVSLKPFKKTDDEYIARVSSEMFRQWSNLLKHADVASVLLWSSDGTEILEYKGDLNDEFDWARYIGGVNERKKWDKEKDPKGVGLHTRSYLYMENPPVYTYGMLKRVVEIIKAVGREVTGKQVRVGATFDPGPEFAKSDFKYKTHPEICLANTYGKSSFACCYATLNQDNHRYAGFPDGIPEGTPFGRFFGRQCKHFLNDLGFDFIWFSNGFGFGCENWGVTGALFDGNTFDVSRAEKVKEDILTFWRLFREECPEIEVHTRGTNLITGVDISTDAVPLRDIYRGGFKMLPPPNSPWAALNRDFGLEIAGYMSRIAEVPDRDFMFRFYVHDPWWMNSPWIDRYEGKPYDIQLPLAVSRIDENGNIQIPSHISFLTVDNTLGEMPEKCPNEIIPYILDSLAHAPDDVSPFVLVYPFDEYHDSVLARSDRLKEVFSEDWFIRGAINEGFPLSTVVTAANYIKTRRTKPNIYQGCVLVTPVPDKGSIFEKEILEEIRSGGRVVFYGPVRNAGEELLDMLNLSVVAPIEGVLDVSLNLEVDELVTGDYPYPGKINHREIVSGGGIDTVLKHEDDLYTKVLATACQQGEKRIMSLYRSEAGWNGGKAIWVRGTNSCRIVKDEWLPFPDSPEDYFRAENLMRLVVSLFGYKLYFNKRVRSSASPVMMIHRSNNAFYFSGYAKDATVSYKVAFPLGAPLFIGSECWYEKGYALYHAQRSWQNECRVFIAHAEPGVISCIEVPPVSHVMRRRFLISGLRNATIRIFPEKGFEENTEVLLNSLPEDHLTSEPFGMEIKSGPWGRYIEVRDVTGTIMVSTPFKEKVAF